MLPPLPSSPTKTITSKSGLKKSISEGDIKDTPPHLTPSTTPSPSSSPASSPVPAPTSQLPTLINLRLHQQLLQINKYTNNTRLYFHLQTIYILCFSVKNCIHTIMVQTSNTRRKNTFSHKISQLKIKSCISTVPRKIK